jgi:hypothetical protein
VSGQFAKIKTLEAYAGSADTAITQPLQVRMTRKQARALEVLRLAFAAARKTGLSDAEIFEAINLPIYPRAVSDRVKPNT